jgi:hypothetical protein
VRESEPERQDAEELTGWKDISAYLGITVRTAQNWERERGLPVRRRPGRRSLVSAGVFELDQWRNLHAAPPTPANSRIARWKWIAAVCLVIGVAAFVIAESRPNGTPAGWRVSGRYFIVTGQDGRELWRHEFPHELVESAMLNSAVPDAVSIIDLDGDGRNEVLVKAVFLPAWTYSQVLTCFSDTGRELWQFTPGRLVKTRRESFPPPYNLMMFRRTPPMREGKRYLVVLAHHGVYYPDQVAILDNGGRMLREYWHSGHLTALGFADLDRDGEPELYLGGVSNSYRVATVVGLRFQDIAGASQEANLDYQLLDIPPASEMLRILFRRTDLNLAENPYNGVGEVYETGGSLAVHLHEHFPPGKALVHYRLDARFDLADVFEGDAFPGEHDELFRLGKLDHKFDRHRDIDPLRTLTYLRRP